MKVWNAKTLSCVRSLPATLATCGFFVAGNEHAVVATKAGKVVLYDLAAASELQTIDAHELPVTAMAEHPKHLGLEWMGCLFGPKTLFVSSSVL